MQCTPVLPASQAGPPPVRPRLGYRFDPIPADVTAKVRARQLCASDVVVLGHLLRFRPRDKVSCWSCKSVIAAATGVSARTVQYSFDRLSAAGVIEQRHVGYPDPEDPKNRTGWRIVFLWMMPDGYAPGPGPARVGKGSKRGPYNRKGGAKVAPTPPLLGEQPFAPPREQPIAPNSRAVFARAELNSIPDGIYPDGKIPMTSSSSAHATEDDDEDRISFSHEKGPEGNGEATTQACTVADAVEAVRECYGEKGNGLAKVIQDDARRIGNQIRGNWLAFTVAVFLGHRALKGKVPDSPWYYTRAVTVDYGDNGIPTAEAWAYRDKLRAKQWRLLEMAEEAEQEEARQAAGKIEGAKQILEQIEGMGYRCVEIDGGLIRPLAVRNDAAPIPNEMGDSIKYHKPEMLAIIRARPPLTEADRAALEASNAARAEYVRTEPERKMAEIKAAQQEARARQCRWERAKSVNPVLTYLEFLEADAGPKSPQPEAPPRVGPCPRREQSPARPDAKGGCA